MLSPERPALAGTTPVVSTQARYTESTIESEYVYRTTRVVKEEGRIQVQPVETHYRFKTDARLPRLGLMMVGWGGNNGSTLTASIMANRRQMTWNTKEGAQVPNYLGSLTQTATFHLGVDQDGKDVHVPLSDMIPMVHPNDLVIGGWDISSANLAQAMQRAQVLDYDLQRQLMADMAQHQPLPSLYYPDFIAANQADRADNVIPGSDKQQHLETLRKDIRDFKIKHGLDKIVVVWTATTERFCEVIPGVNDTAEALMAAIASSHPEIAPSTLFAVASILEGVPFINGSPQNTSVPAIVELALRQNVFIGGDDFKSGQTKLKSVLMDFLVGAGLKPVAITSYNHLGNNDGRNLSAPPQFRSKEISKSNVVDDVVASNTILYPPNPKNGSVHGPDHTVVIKYCPAVGDSKRAMDEYVSEIFMEGKSTIAVYNVCEDSLLAAPLILDLALLTELFTRVKVQVAPEAERRCTGRPIATGEWTTFHPVLSLLSYLLKAPMVPTGAPTVHALSKQRSALENVVRALLGLAPVHDMQLECRI